jgi:hypothetical protein
VKPLLSSALPVGLLFLISLTLMEDAQSIVPAPSKAVAVDVAPGPTCGSLGPPQDKTAIARIGSLFERPASVAMLLQNLKIAYDRKLLLAPEFYDEGNLLKFFDRQKVVSTGRLLPEMRGARNRVIELAGDDAALGKTTVSITISCMVLPGYESATGRVPARLGKFGRAALTIAGVSNFTVSAVRAVLGKEPRFLPEHFGPHDLSPTGTGLLIYETPANYWDGMATKAGAGIAFRMTLSLAGRGPEYANEPLFTGDDAVMSIEIFESER